VASFEQLLCEFLTNPVVFFLLVFGFSIAVALVLPVPIEVALVFALGSGNLALFTAALFAVALGKAAGAALVFVLGLRVDKAMHKWSQRSKIFARILSTLERFVRYTGTFGLFVLLSIPFMSDTAVLYLYALFNEEGKALERSRFVLSNFLAGVSRTALFFVLARTVFPWLIGSTPPC